MRSKKIDIAPSYLTATTKNSFASKSLKGLAFLIPSLLLVWAIWLPFGFSLTGLIEEWGVLGLFTKLGLFFIADTSSPLAAHALRPLTIFPQAVAYYLDPHSFHYWHVLLIAALITKGIASSTLFWQATGSLRWATIMGLIVLIYPADTMQLAMRALHINWSLSLLLVSCSVFITAYRTPRTVSAYAWGILAAALLWAAIGMYEAALMLVFLPFLIMYARDGLRPNLQLWYARKGLILIWLLSIGLYLAYVVVVSAKISSYQHAITVGQNPLAILWSTFPRLFNPGIVHSIAGGWVSAMGIVLKELSSWAYLYLALAIAVIFGSVGYIFKRNKLADADTAEDTISRRLLRRLIVVALSLVILGYIPYLFSNAHIHISQRTYLFATFGAAMFWTALLMMLAQWRKITAMIGAIVLITIGLGAQIYQFHHYVQISQTQRTILKNIISNFDGQLDGKTLILLDETNQLTHTWMFLIGNLHAALTYFYDHPIRTVEICQMPGKEWRYLEETLGRPGSCMENEKEWLFRAPPAISGEGYTPPPPVADKMILKKDAVVLTVKSIASVEPNPALTNYRESLKGSSKLAKRYQNILASSSWADHFNKFWVADLEKYRWSFGNWWSMELPTRGSGWREADWGVGSFIPQAAAWKSQENSTLLFELLPRQSTYMLRGKIKNVISEAIRDSMKIHLNQQLIHYRWLNHDEFEAEIPSKTLLSGTNTLAFYSLTAPTYYGLSIKFAWLEILPA